MKRSPLLSICLIVLVDVLGLTLILPLLPFYAEHFGAKPFTVGLLMSVFGLCQFIGAPVLGRLSDRVGRKKVLLVSQMGTFVGFLILAFAPSLSWVFLSRIVDGLTAGNISVAQAFIADEAEPRHRARFFAFIGVAFGIGFLIGPAVTGFLLHFGYVYPIFLAALLSLTSVFCTFFLLPSAAGRDSDSVAKESRTVSFQRVLRNRPLLTFLGQFFFFVVGFGTLVSGLALFAERRFTYQGLPFQAREVAYLMAYNGFIGVLAQGIFTGILVRRFGERKIVASGLVGMASGFFILLFAHTIPVLVLSMTVFSAGNALVWPSLTSLISQAAAKGEQGRALGMKESLMAISQVIVPAVGGLLIQWGHLNWWVAMGGTAIAAALAIQAFARKVVLGENA